jgi:tripartite-type tricarboxylate transporter receptor subunit TctC
VRIIVPLAAGGSMDSVARGLSARLGDNLKQSVVIDNRPGAGALIALDILSSAAADGHTLMVIGGTSIVYPILYKSRYDMRRDVSHVSQLTAQGYVLVIHPSLPAKTPSEFVNYIKVNPNKVNYSSSGIASPTHMAGELLQLATGGRMTHIPYKGMGAAYTDLISGQMQASFPAAISSMAHVTAGRLRAIGVTTPKRMSVLPNTPTFVEAGYDSMIVLNWYSLIAPLKMPAALAEQIAAETRKAVLSPEMGKSLAAEGSEAVGSTPAELASHVRLEHDKWARVVKAAGITAQ